MLRVGQKRRVQAVAAREEIRHARKKHVHVAAKVAMPRARMMNADAVAKDALRLAAKVVLHLAAKVALRLAAKVVLRLAVKVVLRLAAKVAPLPAAKVAPRPAAKVAPLPAAKVAPLPAAKVAPHRVARAALAHGWKRPLVVAVTRSRRLRVVAQPSHRVHRDR